MEVQGIISAEPSHVGLLREETLTLRWLFGYCQKDQCFHPQWSHLPVTTISGSEIMNVRFMSIDVDAFQEAEGIIQRFHIGVSVLDAKSLEDALHVSSDPKQLTKVIKSHHYNVGGRGYGFFRSRLFLFGNPERVTVATLKDKLQSLTSMQNIVLVIHGGDRELSVLRRLDIDLKQLCTIDTVKAAQYPLRLSYRYSLRKLLEEFGIPFSHLHVAGNDAHFMLRALLMIVVRDAEQNSAVSPSWISRLKAIAQSPLPASLEEKRDRKREQQLLEEAEKLREV